MPNTAFATDEENNNELSKKQQIIQRLHEKYGEDLPSYEGVGGSWGFEDSEESLEFGSLIPDMDGSVASPLWGNTKDTTVKEKNHAYGTHDYIIEQANAESEVKISTNYIDLVYEISKRCDTEYGPKIDKKNNSNFCTAFHANDNYIASITYLWRFARLIGKKKSSTSWLPSNPSNEDIENFIDKASEEALKELPAEAKKNTFKKVKNTGDTDKDMVEVNVMKNLRAKSAKMVKKYYKTTSIKNNSKQTWAGRCKYIIHGMIMHCIGDVYAHKVMLKKNAADKVKEKRDNPDSDITLTTVAQREKYLDPTFFNKDNCTKDDLDKLINNISGKTTEKPDGIPIFQLKEYVKESEKDKSHKDYADNPKFYNKRVCEAIDSAWPFLESYSLTIYCIEDYASEVAGCLEPENYKLFRFDVYQEQLNI